MLGCYWLAREMGRGYEQGGLCFKALKNKEADLLTPWQKLFGNVINSFDK